jgi:hypothetical protein
MNTIKSVYPVLILNGQEKLQMIVAGPVLVFSPCKVNLSLKYLETKVHFANAATFAFSAFRLLSSPLRPPATHIDCGSRKCKQFKMLRRHRRVSPSKDQRPAEDDRKVVDKGSLFRLVQRLSRLCLQPPLQHQGGGGRKFWVVRRTGISGRTDGRNLCHRCFEASEISLAENNQWYNNLDLLSI